MSAQKRWRVGRKVGRHLYLQLGPEPSDVDPPIDTLDTAELARQAVDAVNATAAPTGTDDLRDRGKLVRDRIPAILRAQGQTPDVHIATDGEYQLRLRAKLSEEVNEYLDSGALEELVDVLEVVYALADRDELERLRAIKHAECGGFDCRYVLAAPGPF